MKIAATYLDGEIFQHFGHTEYFKIYETDGKTVQSSEVVSSDGFGHGALAGFLKGAAWMRSCAAASAAGPYRRLRKLA